MFKELWFACERQYWGSINKKHPQRVRTASVQEIAHRMQESGSAIIVFFGGRWAMINALFRGNQTMGVLGAHLFKSLGNCHRENDYVGRNVGDLAIQLEALRGESATYQNTTDKLLAKLTEQYGVAVSQSQAHGQRADKLEQCISELSCSIATKTRRGR